MRSDAFGGALLLGATVAALVLANSSWSAGYAAVRDFTFGIPELHLELSVGAWASDGLLAIFFFVVGLELKEEFVHGALRNVRAAVLPIGAAVGGVLAPAGVFLLINISSGADALRGWAIPTATDIAFAVAIIAVVGRSLPPALRVFLLTLAIVDDLIAITIIATFYTDTISVPWLTLSLLPLAGFALLVGRGVRTWWILIPLATATWVCIHASGVHATIAGVLLGFVVPVTATAEARVRIDRNLEGHPIYEGMAQHFARRWSPIATLVAVPTFAFFAAGVPIGGIEGVQSALADPLTVGIVIALVLGKPLGILLTTALLAGLRLARLDPTLTWPDLFGMSFLAGIGFTVSLLIGDLAFGAASGADEHVKIGVLLGSLLAAMIGATILGVRNRHARDKGAVSGLPER